MLVELAEADVLVFGSPRILKTALVVSSEVTTDSAVIIIKMTDLLSETGKFICFVHLLVGYMKCRLFRL